MQTVSKQSKKHPPPHWTDEEKGEFYAKLEAANRARQLDWYDDTFGQSLKTCGAAEFGVIMAGGVFPIVMSLCGIASVLYSRASYGGSFLPIAVELGYEIAPYGLLGIFACFFGMTAGILLQFLAKYLMAATNSSLGFPIQARRQILMTGGLAGFLSLGWGMAIPFPINSWQGPAVFLLVVFFGMLLCHIGAQWSAGRIDTWFDSFSPLATKRDAKSGQRKQFRLANLFWITLLFAVLFAIQRVTGIKITRTLIVYTVFQAILIGVDMLWLRFACPRNEKPADTA